MYTNSLAWPSMFDVARNKVSVIEDNQSIVNRSKLLILTDPTELHMNPNFGVGLKKYLWQYNTANQKERIKDDIVSQLRLHEPCSIIEETQISEGLLFTGTSDVETTKDTQQSLKMTLTIKTTYGSTLNIDTADLQSIVDYFNSLA